MTSKTFFRLISNGEEDIVKYLLDTLNDLSIDYCVIGGLAVNAYVEPVVSLDLDIVIITDSIERLLNATHKFFKIEKFTHSINLSMKKSSLRIQIQTDTQYQSFISRAVVKEIMGYRMKVASIEDILMGKIWAYSDKQRRQSKRQKDLSDIYRIIESYPELQGLLPESIRTE